MSLAYKPNGPIPRYTPMGFYAGWAYMQGNRVYWDGHKHPNDNLSLVFSVMHVSMD